MKVIRGSWIRCTTTTTTTTCIRNGLRTCGERQSMRALPVGPKRAAGRGPHADAGPAGADGGVERGRLHRVREPVTALAPALTAMMTRYCQTPVACSQM